MTFSFIEPGEPSAVSLDCTLAAKLPAGAYCIIDRIAGIRDADVFRYHNAYFVNTHGETFKVKDIAPLVKALGDRVAARVRSVISEARAGVLAFSHDAMIDIGGHCGILSASLDGQLSIRKCGDCEEHLIDCGTADDIRIDPDELSEVIRSYGLR